MNECLRKQEKARLLEKIQQQRFELASGAACWLEMTAPYDRIWQKFAGMRNYLVAGASLLTFCVIRRRPDKITKWSKRGLRVWSTVSFVRRIFLSFVSR